ncbi:Type I phosphodiesterase / nucleotide pyrophosphatase [Polystyrenella longa]|uniref:Type I phosphodiesterase / nucleotide pyrophosphatase n=2 Tax=Polystyrenella longa TaxID=2528007 RepID=A0A518CLC2_9PLAN|nr:Type I phosphodiesterase / nucleotide pyrophosphatase [Polystyrenella longa]
MKAGKLPVFQQLRDKGAYSPSCISIFPSITPAATCSLVTGAYPVDHGIAGAYWYDPKQDEIAYFGADLPAIFKEGIDHYIRDFQLRLNGERLQYPTIFEQIEKNGKLQDAVVNFMWYKGTVPHSASTPFLMKFIPGSNFASEMMGPHKMFLGDFVSSPLEDNQTPTARGGVSRRFGFHDDATSDYLLSLSRSGSMPDFTLAYFPNNDFDSHEVGPENAVHTLQKVAITLGTLFEEQGGIDKFLEDHVIMVTGDHSQSNLDEDARVDLNATLEQFQVVDAGAEWQNGEDLMICPNMRAAQIYMRPERWENRSEVIEALLECPGVDQVIWSDFENGLSDCDEATFHIYTRDRGTLVFKQAWNGDTDGVDELGNRWAFQGDLATIDGTLDEDNVLRFGDYPNALERIANGICDQTGNLWVTARLGKEFAIPGLHTNAAGSHGSLHKIDSTSPLFAAGLPKDFKLPDFPRIVDVSPLALQILGIQPRCESFDSARAN